jgi:hypothetical protein
MTVLVNWSSAVHGLLPRGSVPLEQSINSNSAKCEEKKRNLDLSAVQYTGYWGTVALTVDEIKEKKRLNSLHWYRSRNNQGQFPKKYLHTIPFNSSLQFILI